MKFIAEAFVKNKSKAIGNEKDTWQDAVQDCAEIFYGEHKGCQDAVEFRIKEVNP